MSNRRRLKPAAAAAGAAPAAPRCMFSGREPDCAGTAVRMGLCEPCEARCAAQSASRRRPRHAADEEPSPAAPAPTADAASPLAKVRRARLALERADKRLDQSIDEAVAAGESYGAIAEALAVSRQGARQRHLRRQSART